MDDGGLKSFTIKTKGFKELAKTLRNFAHQRAGAIFKAAIQAGAVELGRVAKEHVPQRSGKLKKGIAARRLPTGSYFIARSVLESNVFYGIMQERGWNVTRTGRYVPSLKRRLRRETRPAMKKIAGSRRNVVRSVPPQPFMRPAFDTGKDRVIAKVGQSMGKAFVREFAKLGRS